MMTKHLAEFRSGAANKSIVKSVPDNFFLFIFCCGELRLGAEATPQDRQGVFVKASGVTVKLWVHGERPVNSSL